tara:strand:+ start:3477 stop:4313 length:837 start_codon:yes stop_codon:yes gene_type:complete
MHHEWKLGRHEADRETNVLLTAKKSRALSHVVEVLADVHANATELRRHVATAVLDLVDADMCSSYAWDPSIGRFESGVGINLREGHTDRYLSYHQYRHSSRMSLLWGRTGAVRISDIISNADLHNTEIYSDLLGPDHHKFGIQMALFHKGRYLSDMRIWRSEGTSDFTSQDKHLLDLIEPAFARAYLRLSTAINANRTKIHAEALKGLSAREAAVAELVAAGYSDKEVARKLGVSFPTVRTHLGNVFNKLGSRNRTELAVHLMGRSSVENDKLKPSSG